MDSENIDIADELTVFPVPGQNENQTPIQGDPSIVKIEKQRRLIYRISENPPFHLCLFFSFQVNFRLCLRAEE